MIIKKNLPYIVASFFLSVTGKAENLDQTREETSMTTIKDHVKSVKQETVKGLKKGGQAIKEGAHVIKEKVVQGAEFVADKTEKGAHVVKEKTTHAAQKIKDEAKDHSPTQIPTISNWHKMKGKVRESWGKLTEDDLNKIQGKLENLYGVLQDKYGYTKAQAEKSYEKAKEKWNE